MAFQLFEFLKQFKIDFFDKNEPIWENWIIG